MLLWPRAQPFGNGFLVSRRGEAKTLSAAEALPSCHAPLTSGLCFTVAEPQSGCRAFQRIGLCVEALGVRQPSLFLGLFGLVESSC